MAAPVKVKVLDSAIVPVCIPNTTTTSIRITDRIVQGTSYLAGDWISIVNGVISVKPQVTDEFTISDEKALGINQVNVEKIEGLDALVDNSIEEELAASIMTNVEIKRIFDRVFGGN